MFLPHRWVYGPKVSNRAEHALYDPALSPTSFRDLKLNQTFNITYAFGWGASGYVVNETVSIGAAGNAVMTVGVATAVNQTLANIAEDGILGLGFQQVNTISPRPQAGFFQTLKKTLAQPIFALDFNPQTLGVEPSIEFGALDHSRASGPLSLVAIDNTQGYWNATGIVFEINEQNVTTSTGALLRGNMIFDSGGSTFIDVPPTVAKAYYADVPNSSYTGNHGFWSIPCNSQVPDLKLYMGNGSAVYRARSINPVYEYDFLDTGPCTGRLGNTTNDDTQMGNLGGPFFESHYVVCNQTDGAPSVLYAGYL